MSHQVRTYSTYMSITQKDWNEASTFIFHTHSRNIDVVNNHLIATSIILTTTITKAIPRYPRNVSMPILRWLDITGRVRV